LSLVSPVMACRLNVAPLGLMSRPFAPLRYAVTARNITITRAPPGRQIKASVVAKQRTGYSWGGRRAHARRCPAPRANSFNVDGFEESAFEEEMAVPKDQRPVNELKNLQEAFMYSWGELSDLEYYRNLAFVWAFFFALFGGPIAAQTYPMKTQTLQFILAGSCGGLVPVVLTALRIYLGWSYVGNRLLSAVVEYEETGWYDGQIWVKSPEVLARDRLLGNYKVKPTLARLKTTMLGTAGILVLSSLVLGGVLTFEPEEFKDARAPVPKVTSDGLVYSSAAKALSSEDRRQQLYTNDDVANAEAAAAKGRPGYCGDRYYKAIAGGGQCDKFN